MSCLLSLCLSLSLSQDRPVHAQPQYHAIPYPCMQGIKSPYSTCMRRSRVKARDGTTHPGGGSLRTLTCAFPLYTTCTDAPEDGRPDGGRLLLSVPPVTERPFIRGSMNNVVLIQLLIQGCECSSSLPVSPLVAFCLVSLLSASSPSSCLPPSLSALLTFVTNISNTHT